MRTALGRIVVVVCLACVPGACSDEGSGITLLVDVRTDLQPGVEFAAVEVELRGAGTDRMASAPALASHDFVGGRRIAEIDGLGAGDVTVHVALVDAMGSSVAQRSVELTLDGDTGVTVVIARDCLDVRCPGAGDAPTETQCHGGLCVDARCHTGHSDSCGTVECASDAMCANEDPCAVGTCAAGVCLFSPIASCVSDGGIDASVRDAGAGDAGPHDAARRDAGPPDAGDPRMCTDDGDCLAGEVCNDALCESSCPAAWVTRYEGDPPCSPAFLSCIAACGSDPVCQQACFEAEDVPTECLLCANTNLAACYNAAGCGAVWSCYAQCLRDMGCPDAFGECGQMLCATELDRWGACVDATAADCSSDIEACSG